MIARANSQSIAMASSKATGGMGVNVYFILICFLALSVSLISMYAVLLVLFGLLPAMIAIIIDQENQRYISKLVCIYNLIGIAPFIQKMVKSSSPNTAAIEMILDPRSWMYIFASAAIGWAVYWLFPQLAITISKIHVASKIRELKTELDALTAEWGDEINSVK